MVADRVAARRAETEPGLQAGSSLAPQDGASRDPRGGITETRRRLSQRVPRGGVTPEGTLA